MKSLIKVFLLVLVISLFTGCMYMDVNMDISKDGHVNMRTTSGLTATAYEALVSSFGEEAQTGDLDEYEENGVKYYVQTEEKEYDITEFATVVNADEDGNVSMDTGDTELYQNPDGSVVFTFKATKDTADTEAMEEQLGGEESGMSQEEVDAIMAGMVARWTITFPAEVTQTAGRPEGIYIEGNKLTMNLLEMSKVPEGEVEEYTFVSAPLTKGDLEIEETESKGFTDVPVNEWYYTAVNALAEGGLVSGVGNNKFDPEAQLTIGQFCSIVSKAKGFELGELNGHWSGRATQNCIDAGFITPDAELNEKYYDRAITREEAISAMYLAKADELVDVETEFAPKDVPDYEEIDEMYKETVMNAYNFGITSGMDTKHTFAPKSLLTRAQICQLFYNLNWTEIE